MRVCSNAVSVMEPSPRKAVENASYMEGIDNGIVLRVSVMD